MGISRKRNKQYLSRSEVASILKVSPNTVTRWADAGKLPYIRTLGGHRRYEREAIERLARDVLQEVSVKNVTLFIPRMYGDHLVTEVRRILLDLPGVQDVWASAARYQARVTYDPTIISVEEIEAALEQAGFPIGDGRPPQEVLRHKKDPAWDRLGLRMTQTNRVDIEMSGEFRRY